MVKKAAVITHVELHPLGEIRMGCQAYGISIETNFGNFEVFRQAPILVGHTDYDKQLSQSKCTRYIALHGSFATYLLDIKDQSIAIYRMTIRGKNNQLSEENAILGKRRFHISGFSQSYFLQFPFIKKECFNDAVEHYIERRQQQMAEAMNWPI